MQQFVILDNIRSAHNVGSIFRTADGAGVSTLYLTGYTPTPQDRFGRTQAEISKTSLGAVDTVPWEFHEDITALLVQLKACGVTIAAVEQHRKSVSYKEYRRIAATAFVFGNEVDGISDTVCDLCDVILEIPLHGAKESLNVSVTAGIILFG